MIFDSGGIGDMTMLETILAVSPMIIAACVLAIFLKIIAIMKRYEDSQ